MDARDGIPSFWIRDILKAQKTPEFFVQNNVNFLRVYLMGTITKVMNSNDKRHIIYTIEDGTAAINCLKKIELDPTLEETEVEVQNASNISSDDILRQMALITKQCTNQLLQRTDCLTLQPGDVVKIIGNLRQSDGNYILIDTIEKVTDLGVRNEYLKLVFSLYDNVYPK